MKHTLLQKFLISALLFACFSLQAKLDLTPKSQNITDELDDDRVLTVSGESYQYLDALLVRVGFTLSSIDRDSSKALDANNASFEHIKHALISLNVPIKNITTVSFTIDKVQRTSTYNGRSSERTFDSYEIKNKVEVIVSDLGVAAKVVNASLATGVDKIDCINFFVPDGQLISIKSNLLKMASEDALKKATTVANSIGLTIGGVKSLYDYGYTFPSVDGYSYTGDGGAFAISNGSSTNNASFKLSMTFYLRKK